MHLNGDRLVAHGFGLQLIYYSAVGVTTSPSALAVTPNAEVTQRLGNAMCEGTFVRLLGLFTATRSVSWSYSMITDYAHHHDLWL